MSLILNNSNNSMTFDASQWIEGQNCAEEEGWSNPQLSKLGLYYPLSPCHKTFPRNRLNQVLATLADTFRVLSLQTTFQNSPISALCRSLDQVEFAVTLLAGRNDPSIVVLEVQRLSGDAITFHRYAHEIMTAVRSERSSPAKPPVWNPPLVFLEEKLEDKTSQKERITNALEIAWGMLSTDRLDAQRLGLESLLLMTDPNKSGLSTAQTVTELLLFSHDCIIQQRITRTLLELAFADSSCAGKLVCDLSYLALIVLSQVFEIAAQEEDDRMTDVQKCLLQTHRHVPVVPSLLAKVRQAHVHPHEAYYAIRLLTALYHEVPEVQSRVNHADLEQAQHHGLSFHLALANASHKLLTLRGQ